MAEVTTWKGKMPADMTDEELRAAKNAVTPALLEAQERINTYSAANAHLDHEVNTRFQMGNYASVDPRTFPPYPLDALSQ